jgi:hypothetical protein
MAEPPNVPPWPPTRVPADTYLSAQTTWEKIGPAAPGLVDQKEFGATNPGTSDTVLKTWSLMWQDRNKTGGGPRMD